MHLKLNGRPLETRADITVRALLDQLALSGRVAVAVNGEVVPRADHEARVLREGDDIEVIQAVAGG